jgi:hypothetical protein
MKKVVLLLSFVVFGTYAQAQNLIHYFSFNSGSSSTANAAWPTHIRPDSTLAAPDTAFMTHNISNTEDFAGDVANARPGISAVNAFCPRDSANNGNGFALHLPTTGYRDVQLTYWMKRTSTGFDSLIIEYSTNGTTFTPHASSPKYPVTSSSLGVIDTLDFSAITAADNNPNFKIRFTLYGATSASGNNRYDNIVLEGTQIPTTCNDPSGMTVSQLTPSSVQLAWTSNSGLSHLQWGTAGFTLGTGTIVSNVTSPQTISGITPATNYEVYYQDTCTGLGTSSWVGPVAFSTTAAPFIADIWRTTSNQIKVAFSDSMDLVSANNFARYTGIANLTAITLNTSQDTVTLSYSVSFADGQRQTLIVDSIQSKSLLYLDAPDTLSFIYNSTTPSLVISEIMYNDFSSGDTLEYLEIYNNGTTAAELGGLFFEKGITLEFAPQTLAAGAYQLLAVNANALQTVFGVSAIQWTAGGLSNGGEDLLMLNSDGDTIDYVNYDDVAPWPTQADGGGYSLVLCNMSSNNSIASSWNIEPQKFGSSNYFISPGAANTCSPPFIPPYRQLSSLISVDSQGVADSAGVRCYTVGVVASENFSTAGASGPDVSFFLIEADNSAGITAISFNAASVIGYDPNVGDSVELYGKVSQYRGLIQFEIDSVKQLSTGNELPCPELVEDIDESTESRYIVVTGVTVIDTMQWPTSATQDRNVNVLTPAGDTLLMRLDQHRNLYAAWPKAPQGAFDLVGFGSQFGPSSAPFLSGYQIFPSTPGDLDTSTCASVTGVASKDIEPFEFTVTWNATADSAYFVRIRELSGTTWLDSADLSDATYTFAGLKETTKYFVEIYTYCGCYKESAEASIEVTTSTVGSISELGGSKTYVYPNPAGNVLHISQSTSTTVRNIMGQIVMSSPTTNKLDISHLETGIYLLETEEGDIIRFIKK